MMRFGRKTSRCSRFRTIAAAPNSRRIGSRPSLPSELFGAASEKAPGGSPARRRSAASSPRAPRKPARQARRFGTTPGAADDGRHDGPERRPHRCRRPGNRLHGQAAVITRRVGRRRAATVRRKRPPCTPSEPGVSRCGQGQRVAAYSSAAMNDITGKRSSPHSDRAGRRCLTNPDSFQPSSSFCSVS